LVERTQGNFYPFPQQQQKNLLSEWLNHATATFYAEFKIPAYATVFSWKAIHHHANSVKDVIAPTPNIEEWI
jgi:hypothetical protein